MPTVDTLVAQHLIKTISAARLMGADCILSGIRPQIAQTIVHLGLELNVVSKATMADALALALRRTGKVSGRTRNSRKPAARPNGMGEIPILKIGDCLLVSIQVDMHDRLAMALQDDLTERIVADRARGVMIDISALEIVDSFIGRMLNNIAAMSRVLDAVTVVVGMRPAVAITLVELGLGLTGVRTALNVDKGLALIRRIIDSEERDDADRVRLTTMPLRASDDVVRVRQAVRARAVAAGFSLVDQTKIVTAASEIARNTVDYGGGGTLRLEVLRDGQRRGVRLTFIDQGPGIADLSLGAEGRIHDRHRPWPRTQRRQAAVQRVRRQVRSRPGHHGHAGALEVACSPPSPMPSQVAEARRLVA